MKTIVLFTTTLLILSFNTTFAQNKELYHENIFERTFTKCQTPPVFGEDSLALEKYFIDKLKDQIPRTEGLIRISVLIDSTGKPLCEWIENNSNLRMKKVRLDLLIDTMPNWQCGLQNGYKVNCAEIIELLFEQKTLKATYRNGTK